MFLLKRRKRSNRTRVKWELWFNPPYSCNMKNNIGKRFFSLLDRHFLKNGQILQYFQPKQCQDQLRFNVKYFQQKKAPQQKYDT